MTTSRPTTAHSMPHIPRPKSAGGVSVHSKYGTATSRHGDSDEEAMPTKTAVKVAVRVRPPLKQTDPGYDLVPNRFRGSTCQATTPSTISVETSQGQQGQKMFMFDRVFSDAESQEAVWDYVSDSVTSFVQGYNVAILAYGQSGAGKSYTMGTTSPEDQAHPDVKGIIPRAAAALFEKLSIANPGKQTNGTGIRVPARYSTSGLPTAPPNFKNEDKNWQLKATYVEIYNEQLRDLLVPESVPQNERSTVTIREHAKGRIVLTGLHQVSINTVEDLMNALHFGSSIRQTDATAINSKSSRSHAVFSLNLVQQKSRGGVISLTEKRNSLPMEMLNGGGLITIDSKLHFVDLAGSERLKNSGLTGERVKEGISINAGLTSLGKVISQLSSRSSSSHVSYRDSKLTRLLQDSLGGNAITYMVACVNPVEFHLSETLNTLQYAQRARAIQSKPQIQHRSDDADKQLVIDRLRSEVAFLREQIRGTERSERRNNSPRDRRKGRSNERENELQNQLLDMQENYGALSQRHAKLIAEIAQEHGDVTSMPALKKAIDDASVDRLARSSNFATTVDQVITEYEKTIQNLESSLSHVRSNFSTSENTLLEREARIVYLEALTGQCYARIQKATDREADRDDYIRDIESKLDGIYGGEDKDLVILQDLRKELIRIRESESSAEEYISTLEERLAEAEQDTDNMRREIASLEHIVDRQRNVGKLDKILHELNNLRNDDMAAENGGSIETHERTPSDAFHDRLVATASAMSPTAETAPGDAEEEWKDFGPMAGDEDGSVSQYSDIRPASQKVHPKPAHSNGKPKDERLHSPAQAQAIADKLETVTIELFDLKVEHESTVIELDDVLRRYQIALNTLAELQDAVDPTRPARPTSFLGRMSSQGAPEDSSSREESPTLVEPSENGTNVENGDVMRIMQKEETLAQSIRNLKRANAEKDINITELTENYSQLQDQHHDTLNYIEELKEELERATAEKPKAASPPTPVQTQPYRHRTSQYSVGKDRESRVFTSLRSLTAEHLADQPEHKDNFDANIDAAIAESQIRSERIQTLEAEVVAVRKEMDHKNTMISGLTRERTLRASGTPMDLSLVTSMRDQLNESQRQIKELSNINSAREGDFLKEIDALKQSLARHADMFISADQGDEDMPGGFPETPTPGSVASSAIGEQEIARQQQVAVLQREIADWEVKHQNIMENRKASEAQLLATITTLETTLRNAQNFQPKSPVANDIGGDAAQWELERAKHRDQLASLQKEIDGYKATADTHAAELLRLENSYSQIIRDVEDDVKSRELTDIELKMHRELVMNLEGQIDQQKSLATFHEQNVASVHESHLKELEDLKATHALEQAESQKHIINQLEKHEESTMTMEEELNKVHLRLSNLTQGISKALDEEGESGNIHERIRALTNESNDQSLQYINNPKAPSSTQEDIDAAKRVHLELEEKIKELTSLNEETLDQLEKSAEKERKSSRLVQELEDQLTANFDQHQDARSRLSNAQKGRADVERELDDYRGKVSLLEGQLKEMKRMTTSSHHSARDSFDDRAPGGGLRKSTSHASLPSPPPAVPLPPLPGMVNTALANTSTSPTSANSPRQDLSFSRPDTGGAASPPSSRHASKDYAAASAAHNQHVEDLESRVKTLERNLSAEKQLTNTLEEALVDLETQANKNKSETDAWKKKCKEVEEEASGLRRERGTMRNSLQAVEEERDRRIRAEQARKQLEERMEALGKKKNKKSNLNCF